MESQKYRFFFSFVLHLLSSMFFFFCSYCLLSVFHVLIMLNYLCFMFQLYCNVLTKLYVVSSNYILIVFCFRSLSQVKQIHANFFSVDNPVK